MLKCFCDDLGYKAEDKRGKVSIIPGLFYRVPLWVFTGHKGGGKRGKPRTE